MLRRRLKIRIAVLASGSRGNAIYAETGGEAVLVDAGISRRQIERRLSSVGLSMGNVRTLLVSHEHDDHVKGLPGLMGRYPVSAFMSKGTLRALSGRLAELKGGSRVETFRANGSFQAGPWTVQAFPTPHDAEEPVGFILEAEGVRIGIATDMGAATPEVVSALRGLHALVLEFNHDAEMLASGPYPAYVKARIASPIGHLANEEAGTLLRRVVHKGLRAVILAHLSEVNNKPELARRAADESLGGHSTKFEVAGRMSPKVLRLFKR
ncbi:MAG: MBL fold metallo-hydrolase [Nitrospinota bacterium]